MLNDSLLSLFYIVLLLAANGFFVAAEFALVKARGVRIENLALNGGYAPNLTLRIQTDLEAYLAACQLGITMASLGLGWIGEPAVAALIGPLLDTFGLSENAIHSISFLLGFTIFSSLHIVVGEQVPKTYAIRNPEPVSIICAIPLHFFYILFYPLNWLLNWSSKKILSLLGVEEFTHEEALTGLEIQGLVNTSADHGHMEQEQAQFIQNIFRFDERIVSRVMIPRIECNVLNLDASPEDNIASMRETKHSRFPVVEGKPENLVGVLLMKSLVDVSLSGNPEPWNDLRPHLREPLVVPETLKIARLFETMREEKSHMSCVVDEYGIFVGLVTLEDLLEEIVGEIVDETDREEIDPPIKKNESGWLSRGLVQLADIERETGFSVADDFVANTLSGFLMINLGRIPNIGDIVIEDNYRFTVRELVDRHVDLVLIEQIEPEDSEDTDSS